MLARKTLTATVAAVTAAGVLLLTAPAASAAEPSPSASAQLGHGQTSMTVDPAGISAPGTPLVVNDSNVPLVITAIDPNGGAVPAAYVGPGPFVGEVVPVGGTLSVNWVEYFFGSDVTLTLQPQDGTGTIKTDVGMNMMTGWGYGCTGASGDLVCVNPGTNHPTWDGNVEVTNS